MNFPVYKSQVWYRDRWLLIDVHGFAVAEIVPVTSKHLTEQRERYKPPLRRSHDVPPLEVMFKKVQ